MLEVIGRIGRRAVTAHELGVNGCVLKALWERGLLIADREGYPPIYRISPAGQALVEVMTGRVVLTDAEGTVERIKRTVAAHYRIPVGEMISARRSRNVAFPRQIAMYLARELTPHSLPRIGHFFGDRDHTTVMHALSSVERKMRDNPQLEETIGELFHGLRESIVERSAFRVADGPLAEA